MKIPFFDVSDREARDAARMAIQSAVAAAAMYSIMQATGLPEKFVGVLSAVLVVEPSLGNTMVKAWERFAATVVGCVVGAICLLLLPEGYGTAAALALSMLSMNAIAAFRPNWRYGVVAAVALAMGSNGGVLQTMLDRSLSIGIGVLVGVLVSLVVWPDRATRRAERFMRSALRASADHLHATLQKDRNESEADTAQRRYRADIGTARNTAQSIRIADRDTIIARIDAVERFHHAVAILARVLEEADNLTSGRAEMIEPIVCIRELSCEVARALADGDCDLEDKHKDIVRALTGLRDVVVSDRDDPRHHEHRNAMVFALDEIESGIARMICSFCAEAGPAE